MEDRGAKPAAGAQGVETKPIGSVDLTGRPAAGAAALKDPNNILSKRSVFYDFDKYDVKDEYKPLVEAHAKYLRENGGTRMLIQGNTDERGSREYNIALGQRRSESRQAHAAAARRARGPDRGGEPGRGEAARHGHR